MNLPTEISAPMAGSSGQEYDLVNILSNLASRVGQMEGSVKTFMENWQRQDSLAHESRRLVYERMELLGKQIERLATDVQNVQQDVAEMKKEIEEEIAPTIDSVEKNKERKLGAKGVWAFIIGVAMALASGAAFIIDKILSYYVPKP